MFFLNQAFVSIHSRPKAAAKMRSENWWQRQCFNTQPPEGGCVDYFANMLLNGKVSIHSRPKAAAGWDIPSVEAVKRFNTQPPEGGCDELNNFAGSLAMFQHTAARRRLHKSLKLAAPLSKLFQHTAARRRLPMGLSLLLSNTRFQHTAARPNQLF